MRQNNVEVDIAAWQHVNLLSIKELFFFFYHYFLYYYMFFMDTESVSEVSGPHDMEVIERKKICILLFMKIEEALKHNKRAVSHSSSLLIQSAAGLESLGHMT